ncbi:MAG: DNA mismatch repair protein MutS, partial [Chlamydiia bacterium]|nr:DNA mismatch repair protein MutS [Chlamydiia bacterium]
MTAKQTPMMQQWHACKAKSQGALLFFRLGDFYEAFYDDALVIAKEVNLTLTKRQEIPMCGVPFHAAESYIDQLIVKGHRVAIAEQVEDPKQVKGLVKREVVRIITKGSVTSQNLLDDKSNHYIASLTQVG